MRPLPGKRARRFDFRRRSGYRTRQTPGVPARGRRRRRPADLRVGLVGCGHRGTEAAVQAVKADSNTKLVALADAFADRLEASLELLKKSEVADRVAVDNDHRFVGFDAYQKLLGSGVDVVLL